MTDTAAYLIFSTSSISQCNGDLYSYVFPSSSCSGTSCDFSTAVTGNASLPIDNVFFGVAGSRVCDGTEQTAVARDPTSNEDVTIGTYECAIAGTSRLDTTAPCNGVETNQLLAGSHTCDILFYRTDNPTPCLQMIAADSALNNTISWYGSSFTCDETVRIEDDVQYICNCNQQVVNPPSDPTVFQSGTPRSGGCGLPLVAPAFLSSSTIGPLSSASNTLGGLLSASAASVASASSAASVSLASIASQSASLASESADSASLAGASSLAAVQASSASAASASLAAVSQSQQSLDSVASQSSQSLAGAAASILSLSSASVASLSSASAAQQASLSQASQSSAALIGAGQSSAASLSSQSAASASSAALASQRSAASQSSASLAAQQSASSLASANSQAQASASSLAAAAASNAALSSSAQAALNSASSLSDLAASASSAAGNGTFTGTQLNSSGGSDTGKIIGGVVGGVGGLLLLVGLAALFLLLKRRRNDPTGTSRNYSNMLSDDPFGQGANSVSNEPTYGQHEYGNNAALGAGAAGLGAGGLAAAARQRENQPLMSSFHNSGPYRTGAPPADFSQQLNTAAQSPGQRNSFPSASPVQSFPAYQNASGIGSQPQMQYPYGQQQAYQQQPYGRSRGPAAPSRGTRLWQG